MLSEDRYPAVVANLNKYFGNMRVSEITRKDSAKYIELRRNGFISGNSRGAADSTIYHEMKELIAAFNFMTSKVEPRERRLISAQSLGGVSGDHPIGCPGLAGFFGLQWKRPSVKPRYLN